MTDEAFRKTFFARWADMDYNAHMKNTAYLDYSGDVRMLYFQEHGFGMSEFGKRGFGPVIFQDELRYFKEIQLLENFSVTLALVSLSEDGMKFAFQNDFFRNDGKKSATVISHGAWFDKTARKVIPAPQELIDLIKTLPAPIQEPKK